MTSKGYIQIHEDNDISIANRSVTSWRIPNDTSGGSSSRKQEHGTVMEEGILKPDWKQEVTIEMTEEWRLPEYSDVHSESLVTHQKTVNSPTCENPFHHCSIAAAVLLVGVNSTPWSYSQVSSQFYWAA